MMRVLIGCLFFREYTGSELYVFELAKALKKLKCKVTVVTAELSAEMIIKADMNGFNVIKPQELKGLEFDIIHCQHQPVIEMLLKVYPNTPKVCTIHSEILKYEEPIVDKSIKRYIAIRPSIVDALKFKGIDEKMISLIYNPIDQTRFNTDNIKLEEGEGEHILFVGNRDYLRKATIEDLITTTHRDGIKLRCVGNYNASDLTYFSKYKHVDVFTPTWNVENFTKKCKHTASILLGRTTIEGWMCGKAGWIYDVDANGKVMDKALILPPDAKRLERFHSDKVSKEIYDILKRQYENPI